MARQVLPIVGAVVGAYFGNPQLGYAIGAIIGNAVDPQRLRGPRLNEIPSQTASEGGYRQVIYGTSLVNSTNVIDFGDVRRAIVEERQGKGGGPIIENERLYRTYAIGIGEPIAALSMIRKDGKIVYDVRPGSTMLAESEAFAERFRFYDGSETQLPDPDLEALPHNGVGNTPYYRGTSYLVFPNDDLTDLQGRIPTYEVEGTNAVLDVSEFTGLITNLDFYLGAPDSLELGQTAVFSGFSPVGNSVASAPLGLYVSFGVASSPYLKIFKQDEDDGTYSVLASGVPTLSATVSGTAWHPSGNFLAVFQASIDQVLILSRSGDTFTVIETLSVTDPTGIAWSPDGQKLATSSANFSTTIQVYPFIDGVVGTPSVAASTINLYGAPALCFSPDSLFLAAGGNQAIEVFDCRSATIAHFDAVYGDSAAAYGVGFSSNGGYIYTLGVPWTGSNRLAVYTFNAAAVVASDALEFDNFPASQPPSGANWMEVTHDGNFLAISQGTDQVAVYEANETGDQLTLVADQPPVGTGTTQDVSWTNSPGISIVTGGPILLADLVEDICERCGLSASDLDLAELTDEVAGITLGGPYDGAGAITLLMPAYFFDLFEADRKIHAPKRGAAVVQTITQDDLVEEPDENTLRGQDIEYPRSLLLKYLDPEQNYAAPAAVVQRNSPDIRVRGEALAELPINLSRTAAFQVADKMLKVMWEDLNGQAVFSLPAGPFAWLTPTDCLGLSLRGALYRIRVEKVQAAAGVLTVTARRDRQSAYTSVLTPIPLPSPTPPPPSLAGATEFVVLNIPGIIDADDLVLGIRVAACGIEGYAWSGCMVRLSSDGGVSYSNLASITQRAQIGTLIEPLSAASPYYTDTTNTIRVLMLDDRELESITEAQFLSEQNGAAISRPDGTAELIQFKDVADDGDNEWTLSTLLRGRLNTSSAAHLAGAKFVMLAGSVFVPLPSSLIGQTLSLQFVSFGTSPEVAPVYTFTWDPAYSQFEFPPAHLFVERDGDDVLASAIPRHRFGTEDSPIASANWTGYRFTATDGSNTASIDTPTTTSSATFDCTGWASPVTITAALTNRITGPGPSLTEQIA